MAYSRVASTRSWSDGFRSRWSNEALLHSKIIHYLFVTGYAGFFCAGILLAEIARGRRGWQAPFLIVVSTVIACSEALSGGRWTADHYSTYIDPRVMIGLTILTIALVAVASRIKHIPLPGKILLALGGLTYPLYLLHQHVGFIAFNRLGQHISGGNPRSGDRSLS